MAQIKTTEIAQLDVLEMLPDPLVRVEIRGIGRQLLKSDEPRATRLQKRFDVGTPVDRRTVGRSPADQSRAGAADGTGRGCFPNLSAGSCRVRV